MAERVDQLATWAAQARHMGDKLQVEHYLGQIEQLAGRQRRETLAAALDELDKLERVA